MAIRDDTGDVERLFAALVDELWTQGGAARLRRPLQVSEIYQHVVPYRTHRERLGIDANQDYEMAVLRLLAGEGGFAAILPEEARLLLAEEAASPSPDPSLIREYAGAQVALDPDAVRRARGRDSGYAQESDPEPDQPAFELEPDPAPAPNPSRASAPVQGGTCKSCGRTLPLHRQVIFCPFCGQEAGGRHCTDCGEELEPGWRYCVTCGADAKA